MHYALFSIALYVIVLYLTLNAPRVFLSDHAPGGGQEGHIVPPTSCINPDRKILFTWNLAQSYFLVLQKIGRKKIQNCSSSDADVTNYVNFFKNCAKNG